MFKWLISFASLSLDGWADIAEMVTAFGVVFLFAQIFLARRDSKIGLITGMTEQMLEIDRSLIEYPEMRQYFGGGEEPAPADTERARAIAYALANSLDHVVNHFGLMDRKARTAWDAYIKEVYEKSPVLEATLDEHPAWWPYLQDKIAELSPSTPTRAPATSASP
jgi:hypothetical protein